jgi:hypothetical protein
MSPASQPLSHPRCLSFGDLVAVILTQLCATLPPRRTRLSAPSLSGPHISCRCSSRLEHRRVWGIWPSRRADAERRNETTRSPGRIGWKSVMGVGILQAFFDFRIDTPPLRKSDGILHSAVYASCEPMRLASGLPHLSYYDTPPQR